MATLSDVRGRLRVALEDSTGTPLWSDAELDQALRYALDSYSGTFPDERTATITIADGDTTATLPDDCLRVLRVVGSDLVVPGRAAPIRSTTGEELAWELFAGLLRFSRPAAAGTFTVWYEAFRDFPANEAALFPVPTGDVSVIVAGATVWALDLRMREEWKRGPLPPRMLQALDAARAEHKRLWESRTRRARFHTVTTTG